MSEENKQDEKKLRNAAIAGASNEVVQRYGSAIKEHYVAYSGMDNETGKKLLRGLKDISNYKTNENCYDLNIKQQAGFAAERKAVARKNAENIINRKTTRTVSTDDLGRVNDQIYDQVDIDELGNVIQGTGVQMKFVGSSPEDCLKKLNSKNFQKYVDKDVKIAVPDEYFDDLMGINGEKGIIDKKIENLEKQVRSLQDKGNTELAKEKINEIEKQKKIKKNLSKSGVTNEEAIEARVNPKLSTAKDSIKIAHKAGVNQAAMGAGISGSVSLIKNVVRYWKDDINAEEATKNVVKDLSTGAAVGYGTGFVGSLTKGALQNSSSSTLRAASKTNLPSRLVTVTCNVGKVMKSYIKGEIDGVECIERLGKDGFAEVSSVMGATVAASLAGESVALGVLAGLAGSTVGYMAAVVVYQELATSLKNAKLAKEERIRVEKECQEAIELIEQYRSEMNSQVRKYLFESINIFSVGFQEMDEAILCNDINGFISGNNRIKTLLGYEIQFETQEEFDDLMLSDSTFKL